MKEVKSFIRPELAEAVISELEVNGLKGMTVFDVSLLGNWTDPERSKLSVEYCKKYCNCTKIEFVCRDYELENFVSIILEKAHTGQKGDGKIFITDIRDAVNIRTKERGIDAI